MLTVSSVVGSIVTFSANVTLQLFEGYKLRVIEAQVEAEYRNDAGLVEATESFQNLRLLDDKSMSYILRQVNDNSKLIDLELAGGNPLSNTLASFPADSASGGADCRTVCGSIWPGATTSRTT